MRTYSPKNKKQNQFPIFDFWLLRKAATIHLIYFNNKFCIQVLRRKFEILSSLNLACIFRLNSFSNSQK